MKPYLFAACAAALTAAAGAASAGEVQIRDAVARVVVIPEAGRTEIAVEIVPGTTDLPALQVTRRGDDVRIDGDLRRRVRNCRRSGLVLSDHVSPTDVPSNLTVDVRGHGEIRVADTALITVRTPMDVEIDASGAVWGAIGRADSVELGAGGCGDWTVGNVARNLTIAVGGSGDVRAGTAQDLEIAVGGSGDVRTGAVRGLEVSIAGSGDVDVASIDGPAEVNIAGSGDVVIRGGRATTLEVAIAGSGEVTLDGDAGSVEASIVGSGDVNVASVSGRIDRSVMGSGAVNVGPVRVDD